MSLNKSYTVRLSNGQRRELNEEELSIAVEIFERIPDLEEAHVLSNQVIEGHFS